MALIGVACQNAQNAQDPSAVPPVAASPHAPSSVRGEPSLSPLSDASVANPVGTSRTSPPFAAPANAPVKARFLALPTQLEEGSCKRVFLAAAQGTISVDGESLGEGDVMLVAHPFKLDVRGTGLAAYAETPFSGPLGCDTLSRPAPAKTIVRASAAPTLSWGQGTMSAHLDVEKDRAPEAYLGRLTGTASVAEHVHAGSWEVLFAMEASGTFTIDGIPYRLESRQVLFVPAGTKHSWAPDSGSRLAAVQMYVPGGPEQRFRALASDAGRY